MTVYIIAVRRKDGKAPTAEKVIGSCFYMTIEDACAARRALSADLQTCCYVYGATLEIEC